MNPELQKDFQNILDCMSGTDGGIRFTYLKSMLETLDKQSQQGDKDAGQILLLVKRFSKLIDVANTDQT